MTMKKNLWLLMVMLMVSCATTRKTSESRETRVVRASVAIRDSIVRRDSVVIRYETRAKDSTVVKDSTVLTVDQAGNVVKSEHWRNTERNREQNHDTARESQHEDVQQGAFMQTNHDTLNHWAEKSEKRGTGVPWYVWMTGGVLVSGIVWFCIFGRKKM